MTLNGILQIAFYLVVLVLAVKPLGIFMARVYQRERTFLDPVFGPLERFIYRLAGINPDEEFDWKENAIAMLVFNFAGLLVVYALQRLQQFFPLNPQSMTAVSPDSSFNTAVSFATNTNWQGYGGETTMSYLTQMLALTVQNFVSAATGMAILALFIRGLARHSARTLGNFWVDMTRSTLYILLPLSIIFALVLVSQGTVQNFSQYVSVPLLQPTTDTSGAKVTEQVVAMGPAASQIAIKQLGTNGGGFFNVNSAHPYENPTPLTDFLEMLSILLIAAALCYTYGLMVKDTRQGWSILTAMMIIFVGFLHSGRMGRRTRKPGVHCDGHRSNIEQPPARGEYGRKRSSFRYRKLGFVGNCNYLCVERFSEFDARFVYPIGRLRYTRDAPFRRGSVSAVSAQGFTGCLSLSLSRSLLPDFSSDAHPNT